jgi:hypothetical protein
MTFGHDVHHQEQLDRQYQSADFKARREKILVDGQSTSKHR